LAEVDSLNPIEAARAELNGLLTHLVEVGGSDLHITAGIAPCLRVDGALTPLSSWAPLTPAETELLVRSILTEVQWDRFEEHQELDFAHTIPGISRFRVNVYRQRGSIGAALRAIPHHIRSLTELGLPASVEELARLPRGLVLVTGPTGSGKSTTLASLLDVANKSREGHIVTIEDPIEYLQAQPVRRQPA
jgi:twitching motility protein PilT